MERKGIGWISFLLISFSFQISYSQQPDFNISLVGKAQYTFPDTVPSNYKRYNDIWGWTSPDGVEYAVIGVGTGTLMYSLQDPAAPELVVTVPGEWSVWRDMKSFGNYIYVVADQGTDGLLIIDMGQAPRSFRWKFLKPDITINAVTAPLRRCHNLYIDNGFAYLAGCRLNRGGVVIFDLNADPWNPTFAGTGPASYAHDVFVQNDKMYTSDIFAGGFSIIDISSKDRSEILAFHQTSGRFTHNTWASDDSKYLFTTDERSEAFIDAYDISNLNDIAFLDSYRPAATIEFPVIPHNVHYHQGYLVISYYTDGVKIVDAHQPDRLIETGSYDTFFSQNEGFNGCWGVFPYFPSGLLIASDITNGLFVLQPEYKRASYLSGRVVDASNGSPLDSVRIQILSVAKNNALTGSDGRYRTGTGNSGVLPVRFVKKGYAAKEIQTNLIPGQDVRLNLSLEPLEIYQVSGQIKDMATGQAVINSAIALVSDQYHVQTRTNSSGHYTLAVFQGDYQLIAGKWGYQYSAEHSSVLSGVINKDIFLERGYVDHFIFDYGWTVQGSSFGLGNWERGIPAGSVYDGETANPDGDIPDDLGNSCFVTGLSNRLADNLRDTGILISPLFDLSEYSDPYLHYHFWFYDNGVNPPDDIFRIFLVDGLNQILIEDVRNPGPGWREREIRIKDFMPLFTSVRLKIFASDTRFPHIYEGGFDGFAITEGMVTAFDEVKQETIRLYPNPVNSKAWLASKGGHIGHRWSLYTNAGIMVSNGIIRSDLEELDLEFLLPGVYFLRIGRNSDGVTLKVIKTM